MEFILALFVALFSGVTLHIPRPCLIAAGLAGMLGWGTVKISGYLQFPQVLGVFAGAVAVALAAEIFARIQKQPATVYVVSGILPLVPGSRAYAAMLSFIDGNFSTGISKATETFLIASYIAAGIAVVSIVTRYRKAGSCDYRK
ncbi:MAG: threonine/serine exporter family protein [Clostridia bacterium]|nr:threonine/serine exporter family protein [Clostridia bacterium]